MRSFSTCLTVQVGLLIALTALTRPSLAQSIDTFSAPGASETYPAAINEFGRVVGYYDDGSRHLHGFVRTAFGTMTTFDAPSVGDGYGTEARVINAAGQIAGSVSGLSAGDLVMRGFVRDALGRFTEFDAGPAAIRTTPQAINAEGQIAGVYLDANFITHGFVRSAQGFITTFDAPAEFLWGIREIRPNGDVIGVGSRSNFGFYGFVRKPSGAFTTFDAPEVSPNTGGVFCGHCGGTFSTAANAAGRTVGYYGDAAHLIRGFIRSANGTFANLDVPGSPRTLPEAINLDGDVAGEYTDPATPLIHGFLLKDGALESFDVPATYGLTVTGLGRESEVIGYYPDGNGNTFGFIRRARATCRHFSER